MGHFVNTDLRKDIEDILLKHKILYVKKGHWAKSKTVRNDELIDDIEQFFEKWYDLRISACLV